MLRKELRLGDINSCPVVECKALDCTGYESLNALVKNLQLGDTPPHVDANALNQLQTE